MTWTELSRSWTSCPCGNGTVVTIREADEYRHIRKRSELHCDSCKRSSFENWKEDLLLQQQRRELHMLHDQILSIFNNRYRTHWQNHFGLCGTKRAVWEILREAGLFGKSLSTFYEELRSKSLFFFLDELPTTGNMHLILLLLEIEDDVLLDLLHRKNEKEIELNKIT